MADDLKSRLIKGVTSICDSLAADSYLYVTVSRLPNSYVVLMRHLRNGNRIVVIAGYLTATITVKKNSRVVKTLKVI